MLKLRGVTAGYGPIAVVRGVDLSLEAGETVALLGPNGAGKSTLLAAITGTIRNRAGEILLGDRNLVAMPSHDIVAAGLALVPEGRLIFAPLTVEDNLLLGTVRLRPGAGQSQKQAAAERFEYVYTLFPRLRERHGQLAGTLSGGEQQMVAIGRALMSSPRLLLLDEPFLGLAPLVVAEIRAALDTLRAAGLTLLIVEQKLDIALGFATRAYVLVKGRVALHESTERLAQRSDLANLYFALAAEHA
jgi:branched-chain amino acid transport system ATP-binding protein